MDELVLELDAAYSGNSIDAANAANAADESQELTWVDIDTFLASFEFIPDAGESSLTRLGTGTLRPGSGINAYFALIDVHFVLSPASISLTIPNTAVVRVCETHHLNEGFRPV